MRKRIAAEDADAAEALEIFCYRVRGYVGPYAAAPDQVDAIVFTAGIGENDPEIRAGVCAGLAATGSNSTPSATGRRGADPRTVSADASQVAVLVVRTNEELEIARQALALAISSEGRR